MNNSASIRIFNKTQDQLKAVNDKVYPLKKVQSIKPPNNFTLLRRLIEELRFHRDTFSTMYNREVI